jgi:hypothetical protein
MTLELVPDPEVAQVIRLDFDKQSAIKSDSRYCSHRQYELDEYAKTVSCGSCGAPLEAFQILLDYAHRERHWRYLDREARDAAEKLAELKAEECKVKARTKNATRKEADAAVAAERVRSERERLLISELARDAGALLKRIDGLTRRAK